MYIIYITCWNILHKIKNKIWPKLVSNRINRENIFVIWKIILHMTMYIIQYVYVVQNMPQVRQFRINVTWWVVLREQKHVFIVSIFTRHWNICISATCWSVVPNLQDINTDKHEFPGTIQTTIIHPRTTEVDRGWIKCVNTRVRMWL